MDEKDKDGGFEQKPGEFDDIVFEGKVKEIESNKKHGHSHHHHHHRNHDSSEKQTDKEKEHKGNSHSSHKSSRSKKQDDKAKKLKTLQSLKKYFIGGWVAVLTILVAVLIVWNVELATTSKIQTEKLDIMSINTGNNSVGTNKDGVTVVKNSAYTVPDYWQSAVDEASEKVQTLLDESGRDAVVFAWFSDVHYNVGAKNSATGAITAAVMDKCGIPFAISTGDMLTQSVLNSEQEVINAYKGAYEMLSPIGSDRLLQVEGNHDGSWGKVDLDMDGQIDDGEHYQYNMSDEKIYNYMFRQHSGDSRRVYGESGTWFYIDDTATKTRFIMLNDVWDEYEVNKINGTAVNNQMGDYGFGQEQLTWLAEKALSFDEKGWAIIVVAHVPVNQDSFRDGDVIRGILDAFENGTSYSGTSGNKGDWEYVDISVDYSKKNSGEIIGFYAGHVHKDSIYAGLSYPVVTITSNVDISYDENEETRVYGTDNEVAVDFVVVNRKTKEVNIVRLGVGEDRTYKY